MMRRLILSVVWAGLLSCCGLFAAEKEILRFDLSNPARAELTGELWGKYQFDGDLITMGPGSKITSVQLPRNITEAVLYRLLPYENRIATIRLSRRELEQFVAEQLQSAKKRRTVPFFDGITVTLDRRGKPIRLDAPPEAVLILNDYTLLSSAVLRPLLDEPEREWRIFDELERDAVRRYLFQHPGWTPTRSGWVVRMPRKNK